jgi:hypothetical protein
MNSLETRSAEEPFTGFHCWEPDEVGEIMNREAAVPSRAVLLATHQPPYITRMSVGTGRRFSPLEVISQEDCLEAIMRDRDPALLAPIIGAPGSGKSHLVLWMKAKLEDEALPNRRIIYLPKGETSLARVIELLLQGHEGGDFDAIRDSVANATRQMTVDEQALRLRDELALAITADTATRNDGYFDTHRRYVDYLASHLPALLRDPAYDVRVLGESGVLRRIVEEARTGGREEPAEIRGDDIPVTLSEAELHELSAPAKVVLQTLANPKPHEVALAMLNKALPFCLSRVFGVEPLQLVAVMRQLRERLYRENPDLELLLMVEDFTLLQGIQYDLLEATIELQQRQGEALMCPMKTIMAVTGGFLDRILSGNDSLRSRIQALGHVYSLDVPYGTSSEQSIDEETVVDFTARYLNAVRLGIEWIDRSAPTIPNACDSCHHSGTCLDAFGSASATGYGLYPFNRAALDRMIRSRQKQFNPRDLLSVLSETLTTRIGELSDGEFPSPSWARKFDPRDHGLEPLRPLSFATEQSIDQHPKPEQRKVLLQFWGGAPAEFVNLQPGIHEAFGIPEVGDLAMVVDVSPDRESGAIETAPNTAAEMITRDLLAWRDGGRLEAARANSIRHAFRDAIWAQLDPEGSLYSPEITGTVFDRLTDVVIENSGGRGRVDPSRFLVNFEPLNDNALLFAALLQGQAAQEWSFPDGPQALATYLGSVDREADRLRTHIEAQLDHTRSDRDAATGLLALTGLLANQGGASSNQSLLTAAMSTPSTELDAPPGAWRTAVSMTQKQHAAVRRFALQAAHVSKDTANPIAIDGNALATALAALSANWQVPAISQFAPQPAQMMRRILDERLPAALDSVLTVLGDWLAEIQPLVGETDSIGTRAPGWIAALDAAEGYVAQAKGPWRELNPSQLETTVKVVEKILAELADRELGPQLAAAARTPWARLDQLRASLTSLRGTLEATIRRAETQLGADGVSAATTTFEQRLNGLARAVLIEVKPNGP